MDYRYGSYTVSNLEHHFEPNGEAYTQENDWGSVHCATHSARDTIDEILA